MPWAAISRLLIKTGGSFFLSSDHMLKAMSMSWQSDCIWRTKEQSWYCVTPALAGRPERYADYQQGWTLILGWLARQY